MFKAATREWLGLVKAADILSYLFSKLSVRLCVFEAILVSSLVGMKQDGGV